MGNCRTALICFTHTSIITVIFTVVQYKLLLEYSKFCVLCNVIHLECVVAIDVFWRCETWDMIIWDDLPFHMKRILMSIFWLCWILLRKFKYVLPSNYLWCLSCRVFQCLITLWCTCLIRNSNISYSFRLNAYNNMTVSQNKIYKNGKK